MKLALAGRRSLGGGSDRGAIPRTCLTGVAADRAEVQAVDFVRKRKLAFLCHSGRKRRSGCLPRHAAGIVWLLGKDMHHLRD
jgi:hypothetical protein